MERLCPYCDKRACNSDDHVFSQFLGGTATIKSCKRCNDTFGHSFEGPLSHDLAPLIVMLRRCGLRAPRRVVWRRAIKYGKTQADYDLDSDLTLTPSAPIFEKEQGTTRRITAASQKQLGQLSKLLEKGGKKTKLRSEQKTGIDIREFSFRIKVGHEARRFALKTAVAVASKALGWSNMLDPHARGYLLGDLSESLYVRVDFQNHAQIEAQRPPLSHSVYVKGNGRTGRCYAVVKLYGYIQLYAILNDTSYAGEDRAAHGLLDIAGGYRETIGEAEPYLLHEAPTVGSPLLLNVGQKAWSDKFISECISLFGDQAPLTLSV
jgi:hypothetical protein